MIRSFFASPIGQGIIAGVLTAAAVDVQAFKKWQKWQDAATYAWGTATFRWVQGAVIGAITGAGLSALAGA